MPHYMRHAILMAATASIGPWTNYRMWHRLRSRPAPPTVLPAPNRQSRDRATHICEWPLFVFEFGDIYACYWAACSPMHYEFLVIFPALPRKRLLDDEP